ncbi:hypothetical protein M8J76_012181 [Diaphorina citri]|nr:hypothetical protein M8J76_012181 [Diaphorina citri]
MLPRNSLAHFACKRKVDPRFPRSTPKIPIHTSNECKDLKDDTIVNQRCFSKSFCCQCETHECPVQLQCIRNQRHSDELLKALYLKQMT